MADTTTGAVSAWEAAVAASANKVTGLGGGTAFVGWINSSEFAAWGGLVLAVAGFVVNLYYKRKEDLRQQREYDARMLRMGDKP